MLKPTQKKQRSKSEIAEERVVASEVMLRSAACAYAEVAKLDPSDPRWCRLRGEPPVALHGQVHVGVAHPLAHDRVSLGLTDYWTALARQTFRTRPRARRVPLISHKLLQ